MQPKHSTIQKLNQLILGAGDNVAAALILFIGAYLGIEYLNFGLIWSFVSQAGYGNIGGFVGAVVFSVLMFGNFWLLIAYKTKGYRTGLLWSSLIMFTFSVAGLNYFHAANVAGLVLAAVFPLITLLAGLVSKDTIGHQIKETKTITTIATLQDQIHILSSRKTQLRAECSARLTTLKNQKTTLQSDIDTLQGHANQAEQRVKELRAEAHSIQANADRPSDVWVQAIQVDTLVATGYTQTAAANAIKIGESTARNRLAMLNGESLRGKI